MLFVCLPPEIVYIVMMGVGERLNRSDSNCWLGVCRVFDALIKLLLKMLESIASATIAFLFEVFVVMVCEASSFCMTLT